MTQPEILTATIQSRHDFTDTEFRDIAVRMAARAQEYSQKEAELASIKQDYKAVMERLELDRDNLTQKIRDGFEMRATQATVKYNYPCQGRKTYCHPKSDTHLSCSLIREEAMDATDFQRELPLEEKPKDLPKCDYMSSTYGCCQLEIGHSGDHAFDGHALNHERAESDSYAGELLDANRFPETGDSAAEAREARDVVNTAAQPIGTSLDQKLTEAAAGVEMPRVLIEFSGKDSASKCIAKWKRAARSQGWPEACISIIDGIAHDAGDKAHVIEVLGAHSVRPEDANPICPYCGFANCDCGRYERGTQ